MFCTGCRIVMNPGERALWCKNPNCPCTLQREPTDKQLRFFRMGPYADPGDVGVKPRTEVK